MSTATLSPPRRPQTPAAAASELSPPSPDTSSARVLFRVPFDSAMSDADADRLRGALDMALCLHPKHPAVRPPLGVARLDFHSGLFLVHGESEHEWALEGRTCGEPADEVARGWELEAILAAGRLDPGVPFPIPPRRNRVAPESRRWQRRRQRLRRRRSGAGQ